MLRPAAPPRLSTLLVAIALGLAGCRGGAPAALTELADARRLSDDLRLQFTKAGDASNRAVMADTDEASVAYAHEAEQATKSVQADVDALSPHLHSLAYSTETALLDDFGKRFTAYRELDARVLALAVENTNLKAQHLSFGPAKGAVDAVRTALESLPTTAKDAKDRCRVEILADRCVLALREIEVLHAPHIAESDDAAMTAMEGEMARREKAARDALAEVATLVDPSGQPSLGAATAALDRFSELSRQIVALSRRNTNVRSLALSLRDKPPLTAACDETLRALGDALAKEGASGTR
jgi:hypothetical protein